MNDKKEVVVLPSDPQSAEYKTITGWVSRNGHYWGEDERMARYDGSTHRLCDTCCQKVIGKQEYCRECHDKKQIEKYHAMEKKEWNGTDGLYSQAFDCYLWDGDEIEQLCEENDCKPEDLMLIICEPQYAYEIDGAELYEDILPEDSCELPKELREAFDGLNKVIRESKAVLSWMPGKFAAIV